MVPEQQLSSVDIESQLRSYEYMSHWRPSAYFTTKCTQTKPFIKLKKFAPSKFTHKHEFTMNHIFIQRMYLVALAMHFGARLELSDNYYQQDELVYGVYHFYSQQVKKYGRESSGIGIKMREQVQFGNVLSFLDIIELSFKNYCAFLDEHNLSSQGEYQQFINFLTSMYDKRNDIKPLALLVELQQRPLVEHYTFNVKLKNAMILPSIIEDKEVFAKYCALVRNQKKLIALAMEQPSKQVQILSEFENMMKGILEGLEKTGKIVQVRIKNASKVKTKQLKICVSFRVLLSLSRSQITVNETPIGQGEGELQEKDPSVKKIEIKPSNASISPVSGNIISATSVWQLNPANGSISCCVSCYNNRKVMQFHFQQIQNFWHQLTSCQQYHDIIGTDKFTISHNKPQSSSMSKQSSSTSTEREKDKQKEVGRLEVTFANFVHGCLISEAIKEIDKVMALAISMDQAIEKGQRKGLQSEDPSNWEIEKYMASQVRDKIKVAFKRIEENSKQIKKHVARQ